MADMKIENYSGTADTFTFPYNPQSVDNTIASNHSITKVAYQRHHILVSGGGFAPVNLVMSGHFSGTNRWSNYRSLAKHFGETTQLKKLYFESDKFRIGIGINLKKTHSSGRTNFIDYVFTFLCPIGCLFGGTQKTSGTNGGDATTFVEEVEGDYDGSGDVTISDSSGTTVTVPSSALTSGDTVTYKMVEMVDSGSGVYVSEYAIVNINGSQTNKAKVSDGFLLKLPSGADITTVTTSNLNSVSKKFRDGYFD